MKAESSCPPPCPTSSRATPVSAPGAPPWQSAVLEALATALLVLDATARVCYANAAAGRLLESNGALRLRDGLLSAVPPHPRESIRELAAHCRAVGRSHGLMLRDRCGRQGLWALATPLPGDGGFVLLRLAVPWEQAPADLHLVRQAIGLTIAEARVACALAEGITAEEYASQAGVSLSTVRTQIRAILEKAGLRRQSDLVRLVARISALAPAGLSVVSILPKPAHTSGSMTAPPSWPAGSWPGAATPHGSA